MPVDITAAVTMTWYHNVILISRADAAANVIQYNLLLIYVLNQQTVAI